MCEQCICNVNSTTHNHLLQPPQRSMHDITCLVASPWTAKCRCVCSLYGGQSCCLQQKNRHDRCISIIKCEPSRTRATRQTHELCETQAERWQAINHDIQHNETGSHLILTQQRGAQVRPTTCPTPVIDSNLMSQERYVCGAQRARGG